jgi:steroid delta-isomerase-like uncharacterized protein
MTRQEILDVIDRWERAFNERDLKAYAATYADHASMESPLAGSATGRDGITKATMAMFSAFPDAQITYEPAIIDETHAVVPSYATGTHGGTFLGIPASGRPFRVTLVFILELKGGVIVRDRRVYDFTGFLVQLGVLKAKPAH